MSLMPGPREWIVAVDNQRRARARPEPANKEIEALKAQVQKLRLRAARWHSKYITAMDALRRAKRKKKTRKKPKPKNPPANRWRRYK